MGFWVPEVREVTNSRQWLESRVQALGRTTALKRTQQPECNYC